MLHLDVLIVDGLQLPSAHPAAKNAVQHRPRERLGKKSELTTPKVTSQIPSGNKFKFADPCNGIRFLETKFTGAVPAA